MKIILSKDTHIHRYHMLENRISGAYDSTRWRKNDARTMQRKISYSKIGEKKETKAKMSRLD